MNSSHLKLRSRPVTAQRPWIQEAEEEFCRTGQNLTNDHNSQIFEKSTHQG